MRKKGVGSMNNCEWLRLYFYAVSRLGAHDSFSFIWCLQFCQAQGQHCPYNVLLSPPGKRREMHEELLCFFFFDSAVGGADAGVVVGARLVRSVGNWRTSRLKNWREKAVVFALWACSG